MPPVLSDQAQAAINSIISMDSNLSACEQNLKSANDNLASASSLHAQDQQKIADLNQKLAALQSSASSSNSIGGIQISPVFGGQLPNILVGIERLPGWKFDTDHNVKLFPHGPTKWIPSTKDDWTDVIFIPAGKAGAWPSDNLYPHWDGIGPQPQATRFALFGTFMLPTQSDYAACQGIECQIEQCINGTTFDTCAWQFPLGGGNPFSKVLNYFDKIKKWQPSPVQFDPTIMQPTKAVSVVAESTVDHTAGVVHMTALTVNGTRHTFDLAVSPGKNQWPGANYVQFSAFQIDAVKNAQISIRVKNCIAMWL